MKFKLIKYLKIKINLSIKKLFLQSFAIKICLFIRILKQFFTNSVKNVPIVSDIPAVRISILKTNHFL